LNTDVYETVHSATPTYLIEQPKIN